MKPRVREGGGERSERIRGQGTRWGEAREGAIGYDEGGPSLSVPSPSTTHPSHSPAVSEDNDLFIHPSRRERVKSKGERGKRETGGGAISVSVIAPNETDPMRSGQAGPPQ